MAHPHEEVNEDWLKKRFSFSQEPRPAREVLHLLGLEECVIGVAYRAGNIPALAYDYDDCVSGLIEMGATPEAALEIMESAVSTPMGDETPVIVKVMHFGDALEELEGE